MIMTTLKNREEVISLLNTYSSDNIWQDIIYDLPSLDVGRSERFNSDRICFTNGWKDIVYVESSKSWE